VALGSHWGAYRLAINTLWGGFDVALMWLWVALSDFSFQVTDREGIDIQALTELRFPCSSGLFGLRNLGAACRA
jgi:hypothetical protein